MLHLGGGGGGLSLRQVFTTALESCHSLLHKICCSPGAIASFPSSSQESRNEAILVQVLPLSYSAPRARGTERDDIDHVYPMTWQNAPYIYVGLAPASDVTGFSRTVVVDGSCYSRVVMSRVWHQSALSVLKT